MKINLKNSFSFFITLISLTALADSKTNLEINGDFLNANVGNASSNWFCFCAANNQTTNPAATCKIENDPETKKNYLTLQPNCAAFTKASQFDVNKATYANFTSIDKNIAAGTMILIKYLNVATNKFTLTNGLKAIATSDGTQVISSPMTTTDAEAIAIQISNSSTTPLRITTVNVYQDGPNPKPKTASLLKFTHQSFISHSSNNTSGGVFWIPLPLDYASQTPLAVDLKITPEAAIQSKSFYQDAIGNWGAYIKLKQNYPPVVMSLHWEGYVLSRDLSAAEKSTVYKATSDTSAWLNPTAIAQSTDPEISSLVAEITKDVKTPFEKMLKILNWTSSNITGPNEQIHDLDAKSVLIYKAASCTGFANIASAMGRAAGIPTRTLSGYLVNKPQQTHFINEFYLGSELGWRRVEPQSKNEDVPEDYVVALRIAQKVDEDFPRVGYFQFWGATGVPFMTLTEVISSVETMYPRSDIVGFTECPMCDNKADFITEFRGDAEQMKTLAAKARIFWQRDLQKYIHAGKLSTQTSTARQKAKDITSVEELEAWLKSL